MLEKENLKIIEANKVRDRQLHPSLSCSPSSSSFIVIIRRFPVHVGVL
jgi:hypothetical protein